MKAQEVKSRLKGNVVPVPGQFNEDLSLNLQGYKDHVAFLLEKGVRIYYLALSASEFDCMSQKERISVTETVAGCLDDSCLLIAQAVAAGALEEQAAEARDLIAAGAHAAVTAPKSIKEGNKFFSSFYSKAGYSPSRHDQYYIDYMKAFADILQAPIVYHDKAFKSGKGPSMAMLDAILDIELVAGLKEHVPDPLTLRNIYSRYGSKVACFDGFGKTLQFWSMQWGASARHSCWSWFDPKTDQDFVESISKGDLAAASEIVNNEWPVMDAICQTGFAGYKYMMHLIGLPGGPCRIPGEVLSDQEKDVVKKAAKQIGLI
ncbi:dihydrodipicolinate synthetase [Desulfatibacillum aliphaticivorans]|uniref:Dihydrodipicolinate synthetase n=2 Tax=Desulfatibacillum aliphaticivorans TaxID=218208 RepID=B8FAR9_DESAL|nr:dihydrodipicolinate synthetase [Desulfatibacillum aliphaticivorans]